MADKFHLEAGPKYLPVYNWQPGINGDLADADRAGFQTSVEAITGGIPMSLFALGGPEVGGQYDLDPMGEERGHTTFSHEDPRGPGFIGMLGLEESAGRQEGAHYVRTVSGKTTALAPQNYNRLGYPKKNG
jgi:hypothetical protein